MAEDHPRVCGEKSVVFGNYSELSGSPPRMRGKVLAISSCPSAIQDHPRVCGEKPWLTLPPWLWLGSPPRMRGKESYADECDIKNRITPAYAGKRKSRTSTTKNGWDHPRVCGEKVLGILQDRRSMGSPPRMRGKAGPNSAYNVASGITPAYAGKRAPCRP